MSAQLPSKEELYTLAPNLRSWDQFINGSDSETVLTRLSAKYPTLQKAIKQMFENGGLPATPFKTKALMTASALVDGDYAVVTEDTVNNGLYVKTAGAWVKSAYDLATKSVFPSLAEEYLYRNIKTDRIFPVLNNPGANLITPSVEWVEGKYYTNAGVLSSISNHMYSSKIPVEASTDYCVTAEVQHAITFYNAEGVFIGSPGDIRKTYSTYGFWTVCEFKTTPNTAFVVMTGDVRVPLERHLLFKKTEKYKLELYPFEKEALSKLSGLQSWATQVQSQSLTSKMVYWDKYYVDVSTDKLMYHTSTSIYGGHTLKVEAGKSYTIKLSKAAPRILFGAWLLRDLPSKIGASTIVKPLVNRLTLAPGVIEVDASHFIITIPEGETDLVLFINTNVLYWSEVSTIQVFEGAYKSLSDFPSIDNFLGIPIKDSVARQALNGLQNSAGTSKLANKKWAVIGDSITGSQPYTAKFYHGVIKDRVPGLQTQNLGIGGTGFFDRHDVAEKITLVDPDFITIFLGTNDFNGNGVAKEMALGELLTTDANTISYKINQMLTSLQKRYFKSKIVVITPIPRLSNYGNNASPNSKGYTLKDLSELLKEYAAHYSMPCLDLYSSSNLPVWIPEGNAFYFTRPGSTAPDGLHPNTVGHVVIADRLQSFLEAL